MSASTAEHSKQPADSHGRLLIVDQDPLARWSLATYLQRWFAVDATDSLNEGTELLERGDVAALIVSDELPGAQIDVLEARARQLNPRVATIRTVTGVLGAKRPTTGAIRVEKPFQLPNLARLLGVPESELRAGKCSLD